MARLYEQTLIAKNQKISVMHCTVVIFRLDFYFRFFCIHSGLGQARFSNTKNRQQSNSDCLERKMEQEGSNHIMFGFQ